MVDLRRPSGGNTNRKLTVRGLFTHMSCFLYGIGCIYMFRGIPSDTFSPSIGSGLTDGQYTALAQGHAKLEQSIAKLGQARTTPGGATADTGRQERLLEQVLARIEQGGLGATRALTTPLAGGTANAKPKSAPVVPIVPSAHYPMRDLQEDLQAFLGAHPNTAGAHFIHLAQSHLYSSVQDEAERLLACKVRSANDALCFGGRSNYEKAKASFPTSLSASNADTDSDTDRDAKAKLTHIGLKGDTSHDVEVMTVYDMRRYSKGELVGMGSIKVDLQHQIIPHLATKMACLPLYLAGAAVVQAQSGHLQQGTNKKLMVAEMGPYFGLSSKCITGGLQHNLQQQKQLFAEEDSHPLYFSYDTYEGAGNVQTASERWNLPIDKLYPGQDITNKSNPPSFLFLWNRAILPVFPKAHAVAGLLDPSLPSPSIFARAKALSEATKTTDKQLTHEITMMSIDSIKSGRDWKRQIISVLGPNRFVMPAGTILFLMDFDHSSEQIKQVYGCYRRLGYLAPAYISWKEHWAFVVTKDYPLDDPSIAICFERIAADVEGEVPSITAQLRHDAETISKGLLKDTSSGADPLEDVREKLLEAMLVNLNAKNPGPWNKLHGYAIEEL